MHIAFVTYEKMPALNDDDKVLAQYLSQKSITVTPVIWNDAAVDWQQFDAVILRSMWDYFEKPVEFDQWLDRMALPGCRVLNPLPVVKWNQDKNYFDDFAQKGVQLPPYVICSPKSKSTLEKIMKDNGWHKAVVKPTISGGAYNTWVTTTDTAMVDEARFTALLTAGDVIVQQFVEEILTAGELSLIFFNKKFSHAICKKAKQGDFRVQAQFGGIATPIQPGSAVLGQATDLLNSINEPLLYARVDGVIASDDRFLLMELELIEPVLSVVTNDKACENFYIALTELLA